MIIENKDSEIEFEVSSNGINIEVLIEETFYTKFHLNKQQTNDLIDYLTNLRESDE